ncbi:hypothetical protein [Erysipelothrix tonsillarum]|uniref:hypothetical protein n=1 Tax=Erysipelothrix tonsillarum TaxID=38402 RepID=UPI00037D67B9|nr:hypothetical protein [Erysipelothrix tonsillarum]
MRKYKVIIWGLGSVGRYAVKMIQEKQSLELVAAIDTDPSKVGKDAGSIFGFKESGIIVTDDIDAALALDADVVLTYLPNMRTPGDLRPTGFVPNAENICKALNAGKNVISPLPVYHMHETAPEIYKMVHECALKNGVTYTQQGIFPGLFTPYLPIVASSMCGRVDKIIVHGGQDDQLNTSPWVQVFGYGKTIESFNGDVLKDIITSYYGPTAMVLAEQANIDYDTYEEEHVIHTATMPLDPPCGHVDVGTISGHEFIMKCMKDGVEVTGFHFVHKVCDDLQKEPIMYDGYHIEGEPTLDIRIEGMIPNDEPFSSSTAPSVNLIPMVVNAEPGFLKALDLPATKPIK